jgi:hypothetical protein
MPRKPKPEKVGAEVLTPIAAEILDQIARALRIRAPVERLARAMLSLISQETR